MGKPKTKRDLADAAYLKTETLRGQIDAFDGVVGQEPRSDHLNWKTDALPAFCPKCDKNTERPSTWTHLKAGEGDICRLQCGTCGQIVSVPFEVWKLVREDAISAFVDRSPDKKTHDKRKGMLTKDEIRGAE